MITPDRTFVRRLRARVRATPEARDPRRPRVRVPWYRRPLTWTVFRFIVPVGVVATGSVSGDLANLSNLLVLWTVLVTLHRAQLVANALHQPGPLAVFYQLPVSNLVVFRHQARLVLRGSLWLGLDWLAFAVVAALDHGGVVAWLAAPLVAFAQWAVSLALALMLVRWNPRLPYGSIAGLLWFVMWIGLQFVGRSTGAASLLSPAFHALERFTPAGWMALAASDAALGGPLAWLVLAVGAFVAWQLIHVSVDALRTRFSPERLFGYDDTDPAAVQWTSAEAASDPATSAVHDAQMAPLPPAEEPAPVDLSALRQALRLELDQPPGLALYRRGAIERFIARRLTERQRVLVDFLQPQGFGWSRCWLVALGCVVVAHVLLVAGWRGALPGILAGGGVLLLALPVFGGSWAGFAASEMYRSSVGLHSLLPLGFWEIAGTRLLISAWRCLIALPLLYLAMAFGFTAAPLPWTEALAWTLRAFVVLLALQPIWVFLGFSKTTNDASSRWWLTAAIFFVVIFGLFVLAIAFIAVAAEPGLRFQVAGAALFLAYTHGALALYGFAYNRGLFDLIGKPSVTPA